MKHFLICCGASLAFLAIVLASNSNSSCGLNRSIIHINGIQTSEDDARANMLKIRNTYGPTYAGQPITYDYAYNSNNGSLWSALAEVYFQKAVEADPELSKALAYGILSGDMSRITDPALKANLAAAYRELVAKNSTASAVVSKTQTIAAKVNSYLNAGTGVVLVPHSQGSLYANAVFTTINGGTSSNPHLKIVAVGDPADSVAGEATSYVTASEDGIINALRLKSFFSGWNILPSNVNALSLGQEPPDGTGHSFIQTYLNAGLKAWPAIKQSIDTAMAKLQPYDSALITASWDPSYASIDFRMLVNGRDLSSSGSDPNLSTGAGWANYCISSLTPSAATTYMPAVYNRGAVSQTVTISGPLGTQTPTVAAEGLLPGVFFGTILLVQNGTVATY